MGRFFSFEHGGEWTGIEYFIGGWRSVKFTYVRNTRFAIIHRLTQLLLVILGVWYMVEYRNYQFPTAGVGFATAKFNGYGTTHEGNVTLPVTDSRVKVWDASDIVVPPSENSAIFITTNYRETRNQTQGLCDSNQACSTDADCAAATISEGPLTGSCHNGMCQARAWCPMEQPTAPDCSATHYLRSVGNYAVDVRASISFPEWAVHRNNYEGGTLQRGYNLFYVADIASAAGYALNDMLCQGGVVAMHVRWDCDIDAYKKDSSTSRCAPDIRFQKFSLDQTPGAVSSTGFSMHTTKYYDVHYHSHSQGVPTRDLTKRWGLRLVVVTTGTAKGFAYTTCAWAVSSLLVLIVAARFACDFWFTFFLELACLGPCTGHVTCDDIVCERRVGQAIGVGGSAQVNDDLLDDMTSSDDEDEAQGTALVSAQTRGP